MGHRVLLAVFGAVFLAVTDGAQAQTVTNPSWTRPPDPNLSSELMPGFANSIGVSGSATVRCRVLADGPPSECSVVSETVPGLGFGAAAERVVASAELRARRVDGVPTPGSIVTSVHFTAPPLAEKGRTWTGPEPTPVAFDLAKQVIEMIPPEDMSVPDEMMEGLDYDRRAVVRPWIEELMMPSPERLREVRVIQFARLFNEDQLRSMLAGHFPDVPGEKAMLDACPEPTAKEVGAVVELRRRYCSRYKCGP